MPVDLKDKPEEDSGIHPEWYNPDSDSDGLEDNFNEPSATDDDLPDNHPSRSSSSGSSGLSRKSGASAEDLQSNEAGAAVPEATDADKSEAESASPEKSGGWKTNVQRSKSSTSTLKKLGIGGSIAGALIVAVFALVSFLMPFKLTGIIESIEQRVGQVPEYAVERRLEFYMSRYLMIRALEETGEFDFNGADRNKFTYLGSGFTDTMYTNWKGAKLEEKMLSNYGTKLKASVNPEMRNANYKLRANDFTLVNTGVSEISGLREQPLNRREARQFIREFARSETKSRQVLKRYNTRKIMKKYYGVGNWRPFERTRDNVTNKYLEKKKAFRTRLVNETVGRLSERSAKYIECLLGGMSSRDCRATLKRADPNSSLPNGSENEDGRAEVTEDIEADIDANGGGDGEQNRRLSRSIMEKIQDFGLKKILTSFAAGIGIIDTLNSLYNTVNDGVISQVVYDKNAQQYAAYTAPILSAADQIRAGEYTFDSEDARVVNEIFEGFEESLVYQAGAPQNSGSVSAQSGQAADCNNDPTDGNETTLDAGETVCPHKRLVQNPTEFTESAGWQILGTILAPYRNTLGGIVSGITDAIGSITSALGVDRAISGIMSFFGIDELAAGAFGFLLNQIAGPVASGAEVAGPAYDNLFAGIAVQKSALGGEVGVSKEDTTGGAYLSDEVVSAIRHAQMEDYYYALNNKPVLERYFSPVLKDSLTGQLALSMPSSATRGTQKFASNIASGFNFFGNISNILTHRAGAQTLPEDNPFHVINMGFAPSHPVFTANDGQGLDPDVVKTQYSCDLPVGDRPQNQAFGRPEGIPFEVPIEADPCLLEEAVLDASTRYFTGTFDEGIDNATQNSSSSGGPLPGNLECPANMSDTIIVGDSTYYRLPDAPNGEYTLDSVPARRYGQRELVCVLHTAAKAYKQIYGDRSTMDIGDLNAGAPHASHKYGIAVDVNSVGPEIAANSTAANYSPQATIDMGKAFVATGLIKNIWWCGNGSSVNGFSSSDGTLEAIRAYAVSIGKPVTIKCLVNHYNHFHIDLNIPRGDIHTP